MKKSLIALAVLGAAAGAAQAQSAVTLYGIVDLWVGRASTTDAVTDVKSSATLMESGGVSGSRWGLTGSEDLGGGLKAVFRLENGFKADTGTGNGGFGRQAYLGLAGGFGTVTFGNTWTAMDDILGASNSGFDSALSASNLVLAVPALYASNPGNTVKYVSPSFGGFSAGFSHSLKEDSAVTGHEGITDFSVSYGAGPIAANFAYQVQNQTGNDLKLTALNGSYDLGVAKLLASYGQAKAGSAKATDFQFGADVPLSAALTLSVGYAQSKDDNSFSADGKRTGFGVAAAYSLSKRTTVYGGLRTAKAKNGGILTDEESTKATVYAVGLKHTF